MEEDLGKYRPAWYFADFDSFIEYVVADVQSIKNVTADPEWLVTVKRGALGGHVEGVSFSGIHDSVSVANR